MDPQEKSRKNKRRVDESEDDRRHKKKSKKERHERRSKHKTVKVVDDDPDMDDMWVEKDINMDGENVSQRFDNVQCLN